jgi:CheY-like chemotaxis protein
MAKPLRILLVEDSERDAALLLLYVRRGGYDPTVVRVETPTEMNVQLQTGKWDVIISDFNLPGFNAYAALKVLKESGRRIPCIVLSGEIDNKIIDGVMKAGAANYLCKYQIRQIVPAIEQVLQAQS